MADCVSDEDRDEMAIPSYQHRNPLLRWMAWLRLDVVAKFFRESCDKRSDVSARTVMDFGWRDSTGTITRATRLPFISKYWAQPLVFRPPQALR